MSSTVLSPSAQRVQSALTMSGLDCVVIEYAQAARTAMEAAQVLGCELGQITKSLIFRGVQSGAAVLVLTSGANRVDVDKVAAHIGEPIGKADAAFTRDVTGYAIGGIPPLAHATPVRTLFDEDLLAYDAVYPAGGTPNAMFCVSPRDLLRVTGAAVLNVRLDAA